MGLFNPRENDSMAFVGKDKKSGRHFIQFFDRRNVRRMMRLGTMPKRSAETLKVHIERIVHAQITGDAPPIATATWLAELENERLVAQLVAFGLIPEREGEGATSLGKFIDDYESGRTDAKESTRKAWGATHKSLRSHFGNDKPIDEINAGDARAWRRSISKGLSENTIRKRTGQAKTLFNAAIEHELITENPFRKLQSTLVKSRDRFYFVSLEESAAVLKACPDAQWRLIFALARFGGLRCPSEVLGLRWADVNWAENTFRVHSPKTEHIPGHASRVVPIFGELLPHLREAYEQAAPGATHAVTRYRGASTNLRTQLLRIISKRLFNNAI
jgi:hypothetical protein